MWARWLADALVIAHLAFVAFVVFGGLLVWRWRRLAWLHVPAALWGVWIEASGGICPLTPLENRLRTSAGEAAYQGDFVARYVLPMLYPEGLTHEVQIGLGVGVLALNVVIYGVMIRNRRSARRPGL